jgi:hypothetical protein
MHASERDLGNFFLHAGGADRVLTIKASRSLGQSDLMVSREGYGCHPRAVARGPKIVLIYPITLEWHVWNKEQGLLLGRNEKCLCHHKLQTHQKS